GAGSVTPRQVVTGADGVARVDSWVLAAGTNSLEAFATGIGPTPTFPIVSGPMSEGVVTFTAAGVPPGTILVRPSSGGVTTQSGNSNVTLPLTQPSGLSMQSGTGIQLEFVGAQPGRWRVVPRDAAGAAMTPSEFVYFRYVI